MDRKLLKIYFVPYDKAVAILYKYGDASTAVIEVNLDGNTYACFPCDMDQNGDYIAPDYISKEAFEELVDVSEDVLDLY